jgi:hypothetical protein
MLSHWMIKLLHVVFVSSLGVAAFWLFCLSLASDRIRRSSPSKRAELFLRVKRNSLPYMNIPLVKSHYLIGRGPECDIPLKGTGIPIKAYEIYLEDEDYVLRSCEPGENAAHNILPGNELVLYNYTITLEGTDHHEGIRTDRYR